MVGGYKPTHMTRNHHLADIVLCLGPQDIGTWQRKVCCLTIYIYIHILYIYIHIYIQYLFIYLHLFIYIYIFITYISGAGGGSPSWSLTRTRWMPHTSLATGETFSAWGRISQRLASLDSQKLQWLRRLDIKPEVLAIVIQDMEIQAYQVRFAKLPALLQYTLTRSWSWLKYDPQYRGHCVTVVRSLYVQGLYFYTGYIMLYLNLEAIVPLSGSNLYMVGKQYLPVLVTPWVCLTLGSLPETCGGGKNQNPPLHGTTSFRRRMMVGKGNHPNIALWCLM